MARRKLMKDIKQAQLARLQIVAELYKRGYSFREIRSEVMKRLDLATYSLETVHKDVVRLLEEWRKYRISEIDQLVQTELRRNDSIIKEAWEAWDKSKTDYEKRLVKQQGLPNKGGNERGRDDERIETTKIEQQRENIRRYGNPKYLEVILKAGERNAKILGYDEPIKINVYNNAPKEESPAEAKYDVDKLPEDMLLQFANKLQDIEFEKRGKEDKDASEEKASSD